MTDAVDSSDADAGGVRDAAPCPGTQVVTFGGPPPNDLHCFNDFACKPPLVHLSCVDSCNGDALCSDGGRTWYATVTCGCPDE